MFLSQTIGRILDTIRHLDPLLRPGALVTDAGSTKCEIVDVARQNIRRCQFLGGHPMAGKEKRGAAAAEAGLFRGRTWALTPDEPRGTGNARGARVPRLAGAHRRARRDAGFRRARPHGVAVLRTCRNWRPRRWRPRSARAGRRAAGTSGRVRPGGHDAPGAQLLRAVARHPGDQHASTSSARWRPTFRNWSTCAKTCARANCRKNSARGRRGGTVRRG